MSTLYAIDAEGGKKEPQAALAFFHSSWSIPSPSCRISLKDWRWKPRGWRVIFSTTVVVLLVSQVFIVSRLWAGLIRTFLLAKPLMEAPTTKEVATVITTSNGYVEGSLRKDFLKLYWYTSYYIGQRKTWSIGSADSLSLAKCQWRWWSEERCWKTYGNRGLRKYSSGRSEAAASHGCCALHNSAETHFGDGMYIWFGKKQKKALLMSNRWMFGLWEERLWLSKKWVKEGFGFDPFCHRTLCITIWGFAVRSRIFRQNREEEFPSFLVPN